jgi:two-component system response regulator AtoC
MQPVAALIERVADCDATVLVTGESGAGKEVVARELHRQSSRRDRPFVKVNCAALPADLLESEMFGHERGAYTGAATATAGKFEAANRGTLMLDEVAEMPAALQAKLLHVLEDGRFTKLGSNRELEVDVRVIAATNRPLTPMIADGRFREDLYYRLQVIEIHVPPLRERREEIVPLARTFVKECAAQEGRPTPFLSSRLEAALEAHDWPGNVRELANVIQRFVLLQDEDMVLRELATDRDAAFASAPAVPAAAALTADPQPVALVEPVEGVAAAAALAATPAPAEPQSLPMLVRKATLHVEREVIARALDIVRWNRRRAARMLGVSYKTLLNKMKALGLDAKEREPEPEPALPLR